MKTQHSQEKKKKKRAVNKMEETLDWKLDM